MCCWLMINKAWDGISYWLSLTWNALLPYFIFEMSGLNAKGSSLSQYPLVDRVSMGESNEQ